MNKITLAELPWFGVDDDGHLHAKRVGEEWVLVFDAAKRLATGETLTSAVWTSTVQAGTDAAASSMIDVAGSTESGTKSSQNVTLGVDGVTYLIRAVITTSQQVLNGEALLLVSEQVRSGGAIR